jgi:hypothetical protein
MASEHFIPPWDVTALKNLYQGYELHPKRTFLQHDDATARIQLVQDYGVGIISSP